ncbi:MAG: LamG-like jellyroll fold domain-containing protein, partial [Verrucomicrobiia bacterium]
AAQFEIVSPMEINLVAGKMRARVPEAAHGFLVNSPEGRVVDLGTEFALDVVDGQSVVHVLEGEIEWHSKDQPMQQLDGGQAIRFDANGDTEAMAADASAFIGIEEITARRNSSRVAQFERWERYTTDLQQDPRLVAHYSMDAADQWSRRLPNGVMSSATQVGEGAVVAAAEGADRWGRSGQALDFSPTGSRVRLVVPGEFRSMTFLTWVKINSLDRWFNSLFLTDGHELHEPHWQIMDDGRLFFSVKKNDNYDSAKGVQDKHIFYSPSFWDSSMSGQWLMVATVYNVDARETTHFLNGQVLSRETIPEEFLVETTNIGAASIGNWGMPSREDPAFAVRNLNGSMDEFAFFAAALSDEKITEIYQHGKP